VPGQGGLDRLDADLAAGRDLFLSSEDFPVFPAQISHAKQVCDRHGASIEVLFFVRDPIARLNSMYTQQVKTFEDTRRFPDFIRAAVREDKLHLRGRVRDPLNALGIKTTFVPFIGRRMGEIFSRVCQHYGFDASPEDFEHTNPAPSPEEIALYRQIGHRMKTSRVSHWGASARFTAEYGFNRKYFGFDPFLIEEVREQLAPEYDDMAELGVLFLAEELQETFFQPREKCADISDEEAFQRFKADIIDFMKI
jgi:hypothetical protein